MGLGSRCSPRLARKFAALVPAAQSGLMRQGSGNLPHHITTAPQLQAQTACLTGFGNALASQPFGIYLDVIHQLTYQTRQTFHRLICTHLPYLLLFNQADQVIAGIDADQHRQTGLHKGEKFAWNVVRFVTRIECHDAAWHHGNNLKFIIQSLLHTCNRLSTPHRGRRHSLELFADLESTALA